MLPVTESLYLLPAVDVQGGQAAHHRDRLALQGHDADFLRHLLRGSVLRIIAPAKEK